MTMLSLPDNWEFSGRGLAAILPDGRDKVFSSLRRLEEHGYLQRNKITLKGKVVDYEYEFCDCPIFPKRETVTKKQKRKQTNGCSTPAARAEDKSIQQPLPENPDTEKPNTNKYTKQSDNNLTKKTETPRGAPNKSENSENAAILIPYIPEPTTSEIAAIKTIHELRAVVKSRVLMYDFCVNRLSVAQSDLDYVVDVIVEMLYTGKRQWIGGRYVGIKKIRACMCKLSAEKVAYILQNISNNSKGIRNYKQYLKAALLSDT